MIIFLIVVAIVVVLVWVFLIEQREKIRKAMMVLDNRDLPPPFSLASSGNFVGVGFRVGEEGAADFIVSYEGEVLYPDVSKYSAEVIQEVVLQSVENNISRRQKEAEIVRKEQEAAMVAEQDKLDEKLRSLKK